MSIPSVPNFDISKIPKEGTIEFRSNASYVWATIPSVVSGINRGIGYLNSTMVSVEADRVEVAFNTLDTRESKSSAINARDEAVSAKNTIKSYVVPTDATYSYNEVDESMASLGNIILKNTQDIAKLNLNIKG